MTDKTMSDRDLLAVVRAEVRDAVGYLGTDSELAEERGRAEELDFGDGHVL